MKFKATGDTFDAKFMRQQKALKSKEARLDSYRVQKHEKECTFKPKTNGSKWLNQSLMNTSYLSVASKKAPEKILDVLGAPDVYSDKVGDRLHAHHEIHTERLNKAREAQLPTFKPVIKQYKRTPIVAEEPYLRGRTPDELPRRHKRQNSQRALTP